VSAIATLATDRRVAVFDHGSFIGSRTSAATNNARRSRYPSCPCLAHPPRGEKLCGIGGQSYVIRSTVATVLGSNSTVVFTYQDGGSEDIYIRSRGAHGELGTATPVNTATAGTHSWPELVRLAGGAYVVTLVAGGEIQARLLDANDQPTSLVFVASPQIFGRQPGRRVSGEPHTSSTEVRAPRL